MGKRNVVEDTCETSGWASVVALDPGGTTGWSVLMVHPEALCEPDVPVLANIEHFVQGQFTGEEDEQARQIMELIECWSDAAVVIEDFTLRTFRMDAELLSPVRITAKVEFGLKFWEGLGGWQRPRIRVFKQQPALAMRTATDARLKEWRLYSAEGAQQHARDATRHGITFLRRAKEKPTLRAEAWPALYGEGV